MVPRLEGLPELPNMRFTDICTATATSRYQRHYQKGRLQNLIMQITLQRHLLRRIS